MKNNQKRKQILDAAYQVMAEKGYESSSIKDIAAAAGLSAPGLVHYYFKSKAEILQELLMQLSAQYTADMQQLQKDVPSDQLGKASLQEPLNRIEEQPEWYKLRYELFALGLRNRELAPQVNELLENARKGVSHVLTRVLKEANPQEADHIASILIACFDGLALQKMLNPDLSIEKTYETLEKMILSLSTRK